MSLHIIQFLGHLKVLNLQSLGLMLGNNILSAVEPLLTMLTTSSSTLIGLTLPPIMANSSISSVVGMIFQVAGPRPV